MQYFKDVKTLESELKKYSSGNDRVEMLGKLLPKLKKNDDEQLCLVLLFKYIDEQKAALQIICRNTHAITFPAADVALKVFRYDDDRIFALRCLLPGLVRPDGTLFEKALELLDHIKDSSHRKTAYEMLESIYEKESSLIKSDTKISTPEPTKQKEEEKEKQQQQWTKANLEETKKIYKTRCRIPQDFQEFDHHDMDLLSQESETVLQDLLSQNYVRQREVLSNHDSVNQNVEEEYNTKLLLLQSAREKTLNTLKELRTCIDSRYAKTETTILAAIALKKKRELDENRDQDKDKDQAEEIEKHEKKHPLPETNPVRIQLEQWIKPLAPLISLQPLTKDQLSTFLDLSGGEALINTPTWEEKKQFQIQRQEQEQREIQDKKQDIIQTLKQLGHRESMLEQCVQMFLDKEIKLGQPHALSVYLQETLSLELSQRMHQVFGITMVKLAPIQLPLHLNGEWFDVASIPIGTQKKYSSRGAVTTIHRTSLKRAIIQSLGPGGGSAYSQSSWSPHMCVTIETLRGSFNSITPLPDKLPPLMSLI